jgi:hypothetical protein
VIFPGPRPGIVVPVGDLLPIRIRDGRKVTAFCNEICQDL